MKTIKFTSNVHLSQKFGGIEHGEKISPDVKAGSVQKIKSDELADHLIKTGLAEELVINDAPKPKKGESETP